MIGRGDNNSVNILPVEQPFVLGEVCLDLAVGALLRPCEVALVTIANLDEVRLCGLLGGFEQNVASNPEANESKVDAVVRAGWPRQRRGVERNPIPVQHKSQSSCASRTTEHEVAACGFRHFVFLPDYSIVLISQATNCHASDDGNHWIILTSASGGRLYKAARSTTRLNSFSEPAGR